MHTISKFFTILEVLMMLIPSVIAAPNENANSKAGLKIVDLSKGQMKEIKDDKVKGVKSSSTDIIIEEKGKNHIKLKDTKGYNISIPNNADHGMWLNRLMQWVTGVGWNFVGDAPTDYTDDISNEITVTVS